MKTKYKFIFLSLLLSSLSCLANSNNMEKLLKLVDTKCLSYSYSLFLDGKEYYYGSLTDYQYPLDFGECNKKKVEILCRNIGEQPLRKVYYESIKKGDINRIVGFTTIMYAFYPNERDIHVLINNITLSTIYGKSKYGDKRLTGLVEPNITNLTLLCSARHYINLGYRRIPKSCVRWALTAFIKLRDRSSENNNLVSELDHSIVLCYDRLDPYNLKNKIKYDNYIRRCNKYGHTNNFFEFDLGSTAIIDEQDSYDLSDFMRSLKIEGQQDTRPYMHCFNRSGYIKYKNKYKWPEKMIVSNFFRTLEKCLNNEIQIVLTNYNFGTFTSPVIEIRRKIEAERKLGW